MWSIQRRLNVNKQTSLLLLVFSGLIKADTNVMSYHLQYLNQMLNLQIQY